VGGGENRKGEDFLQTVKGKTHGETARKDSMRSAKLSFTAVRRKKHTYQNSIHLERSLEKGETVERKKTNSGKLRSRPGSSRWNKKKKERGGNKDPLQGRLLFRDPRVWRAVSTRKGGKETVGKLAARRERRPK